MGWSNGTEVMVGLIRLAKLHILNLGERRDFYVGAIQLLEDCNWDTLQECLEQDPVWDAAMYQLYPGWRPCIVCGDCFEDHDDGYSHAPVATDPVMGYVHTSFMSRGVATGRMSASEPNLSNPPRPGPCGGPEGSHRFGDTNPTDDGRRTCSDCSAVEVPDYDEDTDA